MSIRQKIFSNKWNIGRLIPLHKGKTSDQYVAGSSACCQYRETGGAGRAVTGAEVHGGLWAVEHKPLHDQCDPAVDRHGAGGGGPEQDTVIWFRDYLSNRSQYVKIGTKNSIMKPMIGGLPQGSILPLSHVHSLQ